MSKTNPIINPLLRDTYLAVIKNSVGSKMWRHFYAEINGRKTDIMDGGDLSCAFFISSILMFNGLIKKTHVTVHLLLDGMKSYDWRKIKRPKIGSVLVWAAKHDQLGQDRKHIGFYIGNGKAISNSSRKRMPVIHHWTFGIKNGQPIRTVTDILWHKKLDSDRLKS